MEECNEGVSVNGGGGGG